MQAYEKTQRGERGERSAPHSRVGDVGRTQHLTHEGHEAELHIEHTETVERRRNKYGSYGHRQQEAKTDNKCIAMQFVVDYGKKTPTHNTRQFHQPNNKHENVQHKQRGERNQTNYGQDNLTKKVKCQVD